MSTQTAVTQTYNSFSGVDMIVTFGPNTVGEVQGVSYTVTREKAPLYTMGSANPRSFSRGKRGIAGSLIFLVFDRSALLSIHGGAGTSDGVFLKTKDSPKGSLLNSPNNGSNSVTATQAITAAGVSSTSTNAQVSLSLGLTSTKPEYHDQLPPFDITISAANEYGHVCRMQIRNVEIMNAGSGMSIDDITTDESCTFVATQIVPWYAQGQVDHKNQIKVAPPPSTV